MAGGGLAGDDAYLKGAPCPKCGYARQPADANPSWQCPKCLVAYRKVRKDAQPVAARLVAGTRDVAADSAHDPSVYTLVAANVFALGSGFFSGMSLRDLLLVYWAQSVVIGVSYFIRILALGRFSVEDPSNQSLPWYRNLGNAEGVDRPAAMAAGVDPGKPWSKTAFAFFFLFHYGFFHVIYLMFLADVGDHRRATSFGTLGLCILGFAVHHGYSLLHNIRSDARGTPNLNSMVALPYYRIMPMHATIICGGLMFGGTAVTLLFAVLKIFADVVMHTLEHQLLRRDAPPPWAKD
jgi:hypothetical protein